MRQSPSAAPSLSSDNPEQPLGLPSSGEQPFETNGAELPYPWAPKASLLFALLIVVALPISWTGIADSPRQPWSWLATFEDNTFFASALLAAFVLAVVKMPGLAWRAGALTLALPLYLLLARLAPPPDALYVAWRAFAALGIAGTLVYAISIARMKASARAVALNEFLVAAIFVGCTALVPLFTTLTTAFRPLTLDAIAFEIDGTLGFQPSAIVGQIFADHYWLKVASWVVYATVPLAIAIVHVVRARSSHDRGELLITMLVLTVVGVSCYHIVPIAGPVYAFPSFPVLPEGVARASMLVKPVPRNCMPSLHTAWVLALYWYSRSVGAKTRAFSFAWLAITVLATLGFGFHYIVDLVVAVPFTAAIMVSCGPRVEALTALQTRIIAINAAIVAGWFVLMHVGAPILDISPVIPVVAMVASVLVPWEMQRRWAARARLCVSETKPTAKPAEPVAKSDRSLAWAVGAMFFVSGAAGLAYEVVFAKSLALTFGSTTRASTTVLATYMGGMAAGAWLGGRLARGRLRPLVVYAICEGGVAIWCALSPFILSLVQRLYVGLATGADPSAPWLGGFQVLLGALVLLPPTILMGVTLPVVARQFEKQMALGRAIGLLYGANTLGAALACLMTGYFILPFLGITHTTWLAVMANLVAVLIALRIDKRSKLHEEDEDASLAPKAIARPSVETSRLEPSIAILVLTVGGTITLALEVVYIHLLAIVAGNSAYAFSLMLFAFLLGLGGGAAVGRKLLERRAHALRYLAWMQLGLAACVLLGVFGWEAIPDYFASFAEYPYSRGFGARELIRASVCCMAMIPPALFIGAAYPLAMACRVEAAPDPIQATGRASALNTLGNVTGAFLGSFVLVPHLGALRSLQLLACVACLLGIAAALGTLRIERSKALAPVAIVLVLLLVQPSAFNLNRLASGANVYFEGQAYGKVVDHAESADGGLTMVTESFDRDGGRVLTLLTNGKFQGDDSKSREMAAQQGFALFPLLHMPSRERALVIGFGTGVSARTVHDAGFSHTDIVDLSQDIFSLADKYFASVNASVLHEPRVEAHVTDGRNFLLLTDEKYDLIGLEISSIWFAGAASLYNREFYQLVKSRLQEGGVLQQWVQLHRLSPTDLGSIFASLQAEFEQVWLYFGAGQGVIVACPHDCSPTLEAIERIDATEALRPAVASYGQSASSLLDSMLLDPRSLQAFVDSLELPLAHLVSTDDNLLLEYSTPRGNVRPYRQSIQENVLMLRQFRGR